MITQAQLKEYLIYDGLSGAFYWKINNGRIRAGDRAGYLSQKGYRSVQINNKLYREHRLVWLYHKGSMPENQIDHINRIKTDNRIENLRDCTPSENCGNVPLTKRNKTGYKGVYFCKRRKKWRVRVRKQKVYEIGFFQTLEQAAEAYKTAAKSIFGEFYCET